MNPESPTSTEPQKRFVVLLHRFPDGVKDGRVDHFDLMLEQESMLATWAIERLPDSDETVSATRLPDHRKTYLDYEGPISDGRGTVKQVMAGTYRVDQDSESCLNVFLNSNHESVNLKIASDSLASNSPNVTIRRVESVTDRQ